MAEQDEEIFEINDFTNATEWESFIAAIEQVMHQWGLAGGDQQHQEGVTVAKQHRKVERVSYCGRTFVISLEVGGASCSDHTHSKRNKHWGVAMREMMDNSADFPPKAHHLTRWYGLSQFVLLAPGEGESALMSQAQAKLMISSVSVAVSNTSCVTPVFVQVHQKWRQVYVGVAECGDVRVDYHMIHLRHTPTHFGHLSGLLELFKAKLKCPVDQMDPVQIAARHTYVLNQWSLEDWPVEPLDGAECEGGGVDYGRLSIGAISDPIEELHLSAVWPNLSEETVADTQEHSVLKPTHAPVWSVVCGLSEGCQCFLSEQLTAFLKLCYHNEAINELLGGRATQEGSPAGTPGYSTALNRLTAPPAANMASPYLPARMVGGAESQTTPTLQEALSNEELEAVLKCLFPEAYQDNPPTPHTPTPSHTDPLVSKLKSAPLHSLSSRLANTMCLVNKEHGVRGLALVWYELVQELRYRWENGVQLRDLPEGSPDMGCCLLHQKLQMLNCCIRHKISHEQKLNTPNIHSNSQTSILDTTNLSSMEFQTPNTSIHSASHDFKEKSHDSTDSDSDEFFEAMESHGDDVAMDTSEQSDGVPVEIKEPRDACEGSGVGGVDSVGALKPCGDLVLVATGNRLFVPITQDHTPMTEDMFTEQANVLSRLGTSEEAAKVRAKMQSSSLLSDMQAFKAANPGCLLEDFVRWYSPRDWIEDEDTPTPPGTPPPPATPPPSGTPSPLVTPPLPVTPPPLDTPTIQSPDASHNQTESSSDSPISKLEVSVSADPADGWEGEDWAVIESDNEEEVTNKETEAEPTRCVKGHLSTRMLQPDNLWVEAWLSTTPLPAYKQKRLFDDTREAEKLLHFLAGLSPCQLALLLMPSLLHSAIATIMSRQEKQPLAAVDSLLQDVISLLATEQQPSLDSLPRYQECINLLSQAEHLLAAAQSLRAKLYQGLELSGDSVSSEGGGRGELEVSAEVILTGSELVLTNPTSSVTGRALMGLLTVQSAAGELENISLTLDESVPSVTTETYPQPSGKEYILRSTIPSHAPYSTPSPQRLFCVLTRGEFRLAGAFSKDTKLT
ncbi:rab3 GTPase-activating protein catalytic subunit-like [Halichondria panicea]|uniref:rab3 GTPase-activating protein catalytic subunit-like n=1 Tax=Halichondria panicea TaxID=6063 RepID=UPI00312B7541